MHPGELRRGRVISDRCCSLTPPRYPSRETDAARCPGVVVGALKASSGTVNETGAANAAVASNIVWIYQRQPQLVLTSRGHRLAQPRSPRGKGVAAAK